MERNTLLALKGWLGVSRGGGGEGMEEETSGSCYYSPVSFCISYNVWFFYLLFVFITYRLSCGTMKAEFYFQPEFIFFSELILLKSVILRLSKQAVLIYRLGGLLGLDSLCSR